MVRFRNSIPFVRDIDAAAAFYGDLLGLRILERYETFLLFENGLGFHEGNALHRYAFGDDGDGSPWGRGNLVLYLTADDLDEAYARLEGKAPILHEIRAVPHGERLFRCLDPDGHVVEIGDGAHLSADG